MKKFLAMFGFMMFALVSFTSCSDNDDGGGGYTSSQLVGTWEAVSAQGVCDLEYYIAGNYEDVENFEFNVTFDKNPLESDNPNYQELYQRFCNKIVFTPDLKFTAFSYNLEWDWETNRYIGYWDNKETAVTHYYQLTDNFIYFNYADEYDGAYDLGRIKIKRLTRNELVLEFDEHALEEDGSGHYVTMTLKRIE